MRRGRDRGAVAVEFALVLPLLLALTFGVIAFGHALHVQTVIDNAARDGVRIFALQDGGDPAASARDAAIAAAAPSVTLTASQIAISVNDAPATSCTTTAGSPQNARVAITLTDFELLGGVGTITLTGSGTMRCNG